MTTVTEHVSDIVIDMVTKEIIATLEEFKLDSFNELGDVEQKFCLLLATRCYWLGQKDGAQLIHKGG